MRAKELKGYILENRDRLYTVLKNAGFHDFKESNEEIRCALPNMSNATGVMVKLNRFTRHYLSLVIPGTYSEH